MSVFSSTKQKRMQMKAQRASDRSVQNATLAQQQVVMDEESHNFRLPEHNPGKKGDKGTIFTVFHVKESQMDIQKRITASRLPFLYSSYNRMADNGIYRRVIPIPLRPHWTNKMSREIVQRNEEERFEKYLSIIYQAFPPSRLNHFEHNLDVWRQLWRVCEISDLLVLTVDARHPLFHFPPSLYDFIVQKQHKHMVVVFNKIDLVPSSVLLQWQKFFEKRYPGVVVLMFSSHPNEDTITCENNNIFERRKAAAGLGGRHNVRKNAPIGVKQLIHTWRILAQDTYLRRQAAIALRIRRNKQAEEEAKAKGIQLIPSVYAETDEVSANPASTASILASTGGAGDGEGVDAIETEQQQHELSEKVKMSLAGLQTQDDVGALVKAIAELGVSKDEKPEEEEDEDEEEDEEEEEEVKHTKSSGSLFGLLGDDDEDEDDEEPSTTNISTTITSSAAEPATSITTTITSAPVTTSATAMVRAAAAAAASHEETRLTSPNTPNTAAVDGVGTGASGNGRDKQRLFTVGLVGHPNAGKSSLINSVLGKTVVSVSNTPGHTKHLQTISTVPGAEDVQLCDCPGLVFPAADMPRPLQVLMGIFPLTNLREPYSCIQFLAERLPLVEIYGLQPYVGPDSDCAIHGPMAPGGVSAIADEETYGLQAQCTEDEQEYSRFIYREGKLSSVSRPGCLAHFVFGTVSSPLPVAQYLMSVAGNNKQTGDRRGKKGKKNVKGGKDTCDDSNDIFNNNDGREDMFANLDMMLAEDGVDMGSYQGYTNKQIDGTQTNNALESAALKPRFVWSAWRVCEALAVKKGWREDAGRLDTYRAGLHIIRDVIEGRLSLYFVPPDME